MADHEAWIALEGRGIVLEPEPEAGSVLLRSPRVLRDDPPALPGVLVGRVEGDLTDSTAAPRFPDEIGTEGLRPGFDRWLAHWREWADIDRGQLPARELHDRLTRILQELSARPESVELVLANGFLQLPETAANKRVRTHLISQPVRVEREDRTGDIIVRIAEESIPLLEDSRLLTDRSDFDVSGSRMLQETLVAEQTTTLGTDMARFLKEWSSRALRTSVEVVDGATPPADRATLSVAPALVMRERGAFALADYYERIVRQLDRADAPIPLGLAQLVESIEPEERAAWLRTVGTAGVGEPGAEPLFPLPANAEQRTIIERLAVDSGVVVEGPPGTGKTHTIANLVSALLARGQRVLVTSEKAQALRVLQDKLPASMRELCVSLTEAGQGGSADLNRSVAEIAARKASFDRGATLRRIDELTRRREQAQRGRSRITEDIRAIRESETYRHPEIAPGYAGTAAEIVRSLKAAEPEQNWLPEPVRGDHPPLAADELWTLTTLLRQATPERNARARQHFPDLTRLLPAGEEVAALCGQAAREPGHLGHRATDGVDPADLARMSPDDLERFRVACEGLADAVARVRQLPEQYHAAADAVLSGRAGHLWSRTAQITQLAAEAVAADNTVGRHIVEAPVAGPAALAAYAALGTAMAGGTPWRGRLFKSREQQAVERFEAPATVDGVAATTSEAVALVVAHLRAVDSADVAAAILTDIAIAMPHNESRASRVNALQNAAIAVDTVDTLLKRAETVAVTLRTARPGAPGIHTLAEAEAVAGGARIIAQARDAELARVRLARLAQEITTAFVSGPSPESRALAAALSNADADGFATAVTALEHARTEHADAVRIRELRTRLAAAAPALDALLADTAADNAWSDRLAALPPAWAWRRAHAWFTDQRRPGRDLALESELETVEADIAVLTEQLAAERAWLGCLDRMTAQQVTALQAYRDHVTNIGKGTGKYAERYRIAAREAMRHAQGAVPAWVMPLQQVLDTIPPDQDSFDVVIVDEASQADIASLFLLWLAPRVIVVGDDKQCAPGEVASGTLDSVFERLERYLHDVPEYLRSSFTPRSSLMSMLRTRFGQVVRLREHFRCMPEIITWCSNEFYLDAPLVPVRQFGADRLPPLRTTYVEGGVVGGRSADLVNRPEAEALCAALVSCLEDPAYAGKTFGVVVLQGRAQAELIRNELLRHIDPDTWDGRRLRVGTPPEFQGDERHVVFLSMVVAPEQRFQSLTGTNHQRRFNVAASRARDQLWLFHSVTSDRLRDIDLRHSLLTYMQSTSPAPAPAMPANVTRDERHPDFDSLFEQRVFRDIVDRGYHANPQVEVNNRRLDLVVTGAAGRLAVECDGDAWHSTPQQRLADFERERELRRCGWEFWRIRESEYYLDPVAALSGLWEALGQRGIRPAATWGEPVVSAASPVAAEPVTEDEPLTEDEPVTEIEQVIEIRPAEAPRVPETRAVTFEKPSTIPGNLLALAESGPISTSEAADRLGLSATETRREIKGLIAQGRLEQVGQRRGTRYRLIATSAD
ncbi:AAA domain-containing protein [Nocardia sp. NPDC059240]|uniref:AAA domain-containing protein n=1 Tax=Nocardia sp. NPDC059240 TaxID=3346786 RepID=UPI0036776A85